MIQSLLARAGRLYAQFLRELPKAMRQRSIKDYRWWPGCAHPLITWCGRAAGDHWMNSANSGQHTGHHLPVMIAPFYRSQPRAWLRNLFWTKWESQIRSYRYSADISFISSVQRLLAWRRNRTTARPNLADRYSSWRAGGSFGWRLRLSPAVR